MFSIFCANIAQNPYIRIHIRTEYIPPLSVRRCRSEVCPVTTATRRVKQCSAQPHSVPHTSTSYNLILPMQVYPTLTDCCSIAQLSVRFWGLPSEHLRPLVFSRLPGFNHKYGYEQSYCTGLHHNRAAEWPV